MPLKKTQRKDEIRRILSATSNTQIYAMYSFTLMADDIRRSYSQFLDTYSAMFEIEIIFQHCNCIVKPKMQNAYIILF